MSASAPFRLSASSPERSGRLCASAVLDRLGDVGAKLLPWGILGFMGVGIWGGEVSESIQRLVQQNGGTLFLVALGMPYVGRFIETQKTQAAALTDLASSVRESAGRTDVRVESIQIGISAILDRFNSLACRYPPDGCPAAQPPAARVERTDGNA